MSKSESITLPCTDKSGNECFVKIELIWCIEQSDNKRESYSLTTETDTYYCLLRGSMETAGKFFFQFGLEFVNGGTLVRYDKLEFYSRKRQEVLLLNGKTMSLSRTFRSKVKHLPKPPL